MLTSHVGHTASQHAIVNNTPHYYALHKCSRSKMFACATLGPKRKMALLLILVYISRPTSILHPMGKPQLMERAFVEA